MKGSFKVQSVWEGSGGKSINSVLKRRRGYGFEGDRRGGNQKKTS